MKGMFFSSNSGSTAAGRHRCRNPVRWSNTAYGSVANGKYTYSAYYNQEGTISDIDENIIPAVEIQVYPNR
jgi:hypothetical protein